VRATTDADTAAGAQDKPVATRRRRCAVAATMMLMLSGCSISMPIGAIFDKEDKKAEQATTGSIDPAATSQGSDSLAIAGRAELADGMSAEDVRRSKSALALALDPEGTSLPVNWDNPETGSKGSFRSAGDFFLDGNQLCRRFAAELMQAGQSNAYQGLACRAGPQNWIITKTNDAEGGQPSAGE
jgi:surface antigen